MLLRVIKYNSELTDDERTKILGIFNDSNCPNESIINSLKDARMMSNDMLVIGYGGDKAPHYYKELEVSD